MQLVNSWKKSSAYIGKMHEMKKSAIYKTGLGFGNNECNFSKAKNQLFLDKGKSKIIHFVQSNTIYEHNQLEFQPSRTVTYDNKYKNRGLGYVELENYNSIRTWKNVDKVNLDIVTIPTQIGLAKSYVQMNITI